MPCPVSLAPLCEFKCLGWFLSPGRPGHQAFFGFRYLFEAWTDYNSPTLTLTLNKHYPIKLHLKVPPSRTIGELQSGDARTCQLQIGWKCNFRPAFDATFCDRDLPIVIFRKNKRQWQAHSLAMLYHPSIRDCSELETMGSNIEEPAAHRKTSCIMQWHTASQTHFRNRLRAKIFNRNNQVSLIRHPRGKNRWKASGTVIPRRKVSLSRSGD